MELLVQRPSLYFAIPFLGIFLFSLYAITIVINFSNVK